MAQYINKSAVVAEIERRILEDYNTGDVEMDEVAQGVLASFKYFLNTLEVKEVEEPSKDLEEAAREAATWHSRNGGDRFFPNDYQKFIAGANWMKEKMTKTAIEREVKVDAGGYPYIDATELYDYDNDKPLAKTGDKVKVLIVKE